MAFSGGYTSDHVRFVEKSLGYGWGGVEGDRSRLVSTVAGAANRCMDGRPPKGFWPSAELTKGPAIQGATEGIALILALQSGRSFLEAEHVIWATSLLANLGFVGGVHDFHENNEVHCAHAKAAYSGAFPVGVKIESMELVSLVENKGGKHMFLNGSHAEKKVQINFVQGTTLPAQYDAFVVDAWLASAIGLDRELLMSNLAQTFTALGSQIKTVEVYH